jgi:hypothetical protein
MGPLLLSDGEPIALDGAVSVELDDCALEIAGLIGAAGVDR